MSPILEDLPRAREDEQRIEKCREDRGALPPISAPLARLAFRQFARRPREHEAKDVGDVVPGIGQQRERTGKNPNTISRAMNPVFSPIPMRNARPKSAGAWWCEWSWPTPNSRRTDGSLSIVFRGAPRASTPGNPALCQSQGSAFLPGTL